MSLPDISLSKDDFAQSGWEDVINGIPEKDCWRYPHEFLRKADASSDAKTKEALTLLAGLTFPALKSEQSDDEPFAYMAFINNINDQYLSVLKEWASEISDPELQARIAHILWFRKRDFQMAQLAIEAYLKSAENLEDPEHWSLYFSRIEQAVNLAAILGKKNQHFANVIAYIESILDKYNGEDPLFLSAKLMEILQKYRLGDSVKYAAMAEKAAIRAESEHAWHKARDYWRVKAQWHLLQKDSDSERTALLSEAETYIKESENSLKTTPPSYLAAYTHIEKAIEAFRRIGKTKERVEELHQLLIEYQQKALTEMTAVFTEEVNLTESVERARKEVSEKTLHDALLTLAAMGVSPKVEQLRKQVQENAGKFFFYNLVSEVFVNEKGKVIARKPSMDSSDPKEVEEATRAEMFRWAKVYQQVHAQGVVEPARYQINLEHNVRLDDWLPIVSHNPLIPPNREYIYAKGLHAGLKGDFLVAVHLLIPQLENSVRYLLNHRGIITSKLDDEGIQDEKDLNTLLYSNEVKSVFSENILFDLQGLLINRFGANFRNLMAHGLIDSDVFSSLQMSYLWWLTLHLCCLPILAQIQNSQSNESED